MPLSPEEEVIRLKKTNEELLKLMADMRVVKVSKITSKVFNLERRLTAWWRKTSYANYLYYEKQKQLWIRKKPKRLEPQVLPDIR
jgi:hypothetical protein